MGQLSEQMKKYVEETPQEILDQHWFEALCAVEGIDPKLPNAKKLLKRKQRRYKWRNIYWPWLRNTVCWMLMVYMFIITGVSIVDPERGIWWAIFYCAGGLGWFNIFLNYKINNRYF